MLETLEARELARTAADISARTGLDHVDVKAGDKVEGVYRRVLTLHSGRFALIERSHEFALVPWRPVLERARGQLVTGRVGGEGISCRSASSAELDAKWPDCSESRSISVQERSWNSSVVHARR